MALRFLSSGHVPAFKLLFSLAAMYGLMAMLVYSVIHMKFIHPLGEDAPLDRFSEARAVGHVRVLAHDIGSRQEGSPGLSEAARYIKGQLEIFKKQAGPDMKIEIEESSIAGSFNMIFLGYSISFGYRNHTNVVMRISSADSVDTDPSVLINGHFDSPLGSPGAADCGSCVASMLELARLTISSGWIPSRPIIFLFNGAEELFMLGAHGFMKTNRWRDYIGAVINVEASGTGGPGDLFPIPEQLLMNSLLVWHTGTAHVSDLVCQSGPGSWPSRVYAESAIHPMAHSAAQDVFPVIPGDTDYRMFTQDYSDIPGLDIIFLLGGYFYHTSFDTVDKLLPGSIQARGDNLFSLLKAFTNSSLLKTSYEREALEATTTKLAEDRAVFFDYLLWFMIYYPRSVADVLHCIPIAIFIVMPFFLHLLNPGSRSWLAISLDFTKGIVLHAIGIILAVLFPVAFSILRLLFSAHAMNWFAHPYLAYAMFVPCSLVGLLVPIILSSQFPLSQDFSTLKISEEVLSDESRFWGALGFYGLLTLAYRLAGLSGGFLTFIISSSMLVIWIFFWPMAKSSGYPSLRLTVLYVIPLIPSLTYSVYFGGFLLQFVVEKMGMMGSLPPPYGYFVPDIIVAVLTGIVTGWCVGPVIPIAGRYLAISSIVKFLLHFTVVAMALSSQFFPYSNDAPKRVVFQNTFLTHGGNQVVNSTYDIAVVDSNSLSFIFKHVPEVAKELHIGSDFRIKAAATSSKQDWMALFPVSFLFSGSLKFTATGDDILKHYEYLPYLSEASKTQTFVEEFRRVHLELSLGSLENVWVAVLNITGPLSGWSFADQTLPAPETADGGPPSYICRLSGYSTENWTFWLEASSSEELRVEVAVLDQYLVDGAKKLKSVFPDWVDVTAYSSFLSTYSF